MATVPTTTMGVISDPSGLAELLDGRCALCGCAHTGFGHDARIALWLASCRCGAAYQYGGAAIPDAVTWYRAPYRMTNLHPRPRAARCVTRRDMIES